MAKKNSKKTVPDLRFRGFTDPWEQRQLGEVGLTYPGLSGKTKEDFGHGDARFVTYMNVYSNAVANPDGVEAIEKDNRQHKVRNGDVFFTGSSETPDEVGLSSVWLGNSTDTYLNSFCFGYRPSKQLDSLFLASSLRSPQMRSRMILLAQGISRFNISKTQVMQLPLCFPSLPEQRRIGEFFTTLDNLIAAAERQEALLRQKKQAYLQLMFPQEGETEPRLRFAGFSGEWSRRQLGELITEHKETVDSHCTLPILTSSKTEGITLQEEHFGHKQSHDIAGYNVVPRGYCTYRNRSDDMDFTFNVNNYCDKGIISKFYPVFRGNGNDTLFISLVLNHCEEVLREIGYTCTGTGQRVLAFSDLQMMRIPIPTHAEQQKVAKFFEIFDSLIVATEQRTESLRALKSAYLQRMFV